MWRGTSHARLLHDLAHSQVNVSAVLPEGIPEQNKTKCPVCELRSRSYRGSFTTPHTSVRGGECCAVQLAGTGVKAAEANGLNLYLGL